ncbi:serine/threonine-protein kinase [Nocardia sp. alder85J]|uniref:serine/threonine-protein kinase n=1 Tax=Nocardia sp. alder85J TaxID=2862949 RepID=UPI001CD5D82E|nr:serine/threonine-protein kinase [Nocardia sp. alder85J]MCX4094326.1 protein kinase [Nocardia sp. alder85J]
MISDGALEATQPWGTPDIAEELLIAGFEEVEEFGRGGFGVVFRAVEQPLGRVVAVEVRAAALDEAGQDRFLREQRAVNRISGHPHIVPVLRIGITGSGRPLLVVPFHARGSLERRIHDEGALPWAETLSIGVKLAGALATAHAAGIVHGAVHPANILISDYGEPQLGDFGLAGDPGAAHAAGIGQPTYLAPEVLRGEPATAAADVYGLGAVLFTALAGYPAFAATDGESLAAQFDRICAEPVPDLRPAGVPAALCSAVEAAMDRRPGDRPGSALEFGTRLRDIQFASGLPVDALVSAEARVERPPRPPTPVTRYRPPTAAHRLVSRPRLLRTLREGQPRRLVLIHAPPGYGKSTLAAQWAAALEAENVPVAWLNVIPDDNNLTWALTRLVEAVRQVHPNLAGELALVLEEGFQDAARRVLTTLVDEIHRSGRTVAIVLDDWHHIHSEEVRDAMRFLLDNGCHHLRLIVTSRTSMGLPLARLRVRDELVEIDERALRFDNAEAERMLLDIGELPLRRSEVDHLRDTTEGWAAALQLASLSMRGKTDLTAQIDRISGHHHAIADYLMENVAGELEPELLEFLMKTAVPDTVCADLAEALTGAPGAQELLEEVRRRDLFLRSVDDDLRWFRYHSLFADFLRHRLTRQHPEATARLHATAAGWFAEHDMLIEAVDHSLAAGDPERALGLIADRADGLLGESRMATLVALVAKLPPALAESDPRIQLAVAMANLPLFHLNSVEAARVRVEALLAGRPRDDTTADLALESEIVKVGQELQADRVADLSPASKQRLPQVRPYLAAVGALAVATSAFFRFDFEEVRRWHALILSNPADLGPFIPVLREVITATAEFEQLDIDGAESTLRAALAMTLEFGMWPRTNKSIAAAELAELLYQTGQFAEADELIPAGEDIEAAPVEVLLTAHGTAARLAGVRGDLPMAARLLTEGHRVAHKLSLPRLAARMLNERIRLGLPITHDERRTLTELPLYRAQPDHIRAAAAELEQDCAIRVLLAERSPAANRQAIVRAERIVREVEQQPRPRALLAARLRYGSCLAAGGRTREAIDELAPALSRCAELGLVRFALDSGGPALEPIVETLHCAPDIGYRRFLQRLLDELGSARARDE